MKTTINSSILFLLFLILGSTTVAQTEFGYRNKFSYITMGNGLLNNYVDFIYKDSRGFLWLATNGGGLSRYDGYDFIHFNLTTPKRKLRSNFINDCCEDNFGRLWITSREGIDILDLSTYEIITLQDSLGVNPFFFQQSASNVTKDSQGNMWVYCNHTISKITFNAIGNIQRYYSLSPSYPDFPFMDIEDIDGDGNVWVGIGNEVNKLYTSETGLYAVSMSTHLNFHENVRVRALCAKDEDIWIGTEAGLIRYNRTNRTKKTYWYTGTGRGLTQPYITDLTVSGENQLLVSTYKGLNIYCPETDDFEQIMLHVDDCNNSLNSNFINCMRVDDDIIWIGTETGGVNKVVPKKLYVRSYVHNDRDPYSLLPNPVDAIFVDKEESVWVGTIEGGLSYKKRDRDIFQNFTHENSGLSHNSVSAILQDSGNQLWVGTWGQGITIFDLSTTQMKIKKYIPPTDRFPIYFVSSLHYDPINDLMWIGTDWGIYYYDIQSEQLHSPFENEKIASQIHRALGAVIDANDQLWYGCSIGVFVFDLHSRQNNKFRYTHLEYKLDDPASQLRERISCFLLDKDNVLWIGSNGNGLFKHIPKEDGSIGSFVNYNSQHGLISNAVCGILQDETKKLWISTNNGLSCFDPAVQEFINFKQEDGLMEEQFYWNAYAQSRSGLLYFGGIKGLSVIDPQQYNKRKNLAEVVLTKLSVMNEEIHPGQSYIESDISIAKTIRLHESDKSFSLEFAALNFDSPATARYCYRLKGFDAHWINVPATRRFANYTNLPAGQYTFQVKYSIDGRSTDGPITEIGITVTPFFYKTAWFMFLMIALVICLAVYGYLRRIHILQKQKQHLHKTVEERTYELKEQKQLLEKQTEELSGQNERLILQNEKITRQKSQIIEISEKVQELTADKISFFTNITHEFRTPITLIISPIERALKLSQNPLVIEQLNFVERNSKYLLSLVNQLMDFRKIESGNMKILPTKGNFVQFISQVVTPFEVFTQNRKVTFRQFIRLEVPEFLFDQDAMQKVITNLLANAMRFTPDGGSISLYVAGIKDPACVQKKLYISVRDTGTGISEEDIDKIFHRFYQSETDVKYPVYGQSGTGIGLYVCRSIIAQLGGTIYAVNNKRVGSSFRMLIPLSCEESAHAPLAVGLSIPEEEKRIPFADFVAGQFTILVVEDNEDMRGFIRSILRERYNVIEASHGKEALALLNRHHVDFIITDLMMPVMDGMELAHKVRENFSVSHIPILALTAKSSQESRIESYKKGVDSYLLKPFNDELLLTRINNILKNRERYHEQFGKNMDIAELNMEEESRDQKFVNKALKVVQENYKDPSYEPGDLARTMGVSNNLLNEKLHTLTGQTTTQFIRNCRLNIARDLIEKNKITRNLNISEIAYEVGFNDPKYFTRCFTKRFHVSPKSFMDQDDSETRMG